MLPLHNQDLLDSFVYLLHQQLVHAWVHVRVAHAETIDARALVVLQKGVPWRERPHGQERVKQAQRLWRRQRRAFGVMFRRPEGRCQ